MRGVLVSLLVASGACGGSCPAPPISDPVCIENGLAGVELRGDWVLTGTSREGYGNNLGAPHDITRAVRLGDNCELGSDHFDASECGADDTTASCNHVNDPNQQTAVFTLVVCKSSDGDLAYRSTSAEHRVPAPFRTAVAGVLRRAD